MTTVLLARSLGATLALLKTVLAVKGWDEFVAVRDEIAPKMAEIEAMFQKEEKTDDR